jgi:CRP/FNR family cyclic AMP-dependent transcriptional regulator
MSKDPFFEYLKQVPMFADLTAQELRAVGRVTTGINLPAGRTVLTEGAHANEMVIVVDGLLDVIRNGELIAEIGPGEFAGEMALLTHGHRNATVVAKTDVHVLHLDGRSFATLLEQVPQIAVKMLPIVAARAA